MNEETLRMQMLSSIITESEYKEKLEELNNPKEKESLNENFVGIGAINNPFADRVKSDYELAFEHFAKSTSLNEEMEDEEDEDYSDYFFDIDTPEEDLEEAEDAFSSPSDTNPVVQDYLKQLTNILNTQTDDMFDLKNLKYAVDTFNNMLDNELAKGENLEEDKKPGTAKERSAMAKKARAGKDIGEKGKNFEKIAKSAVKRYGSKEAGERVAGAVMYGKLNK